MGNVVKEKFYPNMINNPKFYGKCQKVDYTIHACAPPIGTVVINKLEQAQVLQQYTKGRAYFTANERRAKPEINNLCQQLLGQHLAYEVSAKTPIILAGTVGELWAVTQEKLANTYNFIQNGQPVPITPQLLQARANNGMLPWTVVRTKPAGAGVQPIGAIFVPKQYNLQVQTSWGVVLTTNLGSGHGKGDFILASMSGNQVDIRNRWVVNGMVFKTTYDNRGWTDCLDMRVGANNTSSIADLPKLF